MKRIMIAICLMFVCIISTVGVFADTYEDVQDSFLYIQNSSNYGTAYLNGRRSNSTDRLSNVTTSKSETGNVIITFGSISRPSQFRAKVDAVFKYNGIKKVTAHLSI